MDPQGPGRGRPVAELTSPNVVLIMSDQHRADMMGCAGDPSVRSPIMDRLAAEGVRFSQVWCQGPLCMPARASFMTERYVRDHGVFDNWAEIDPASPTYVWSLREAGYHTALIGKAHLYRDEGLVAHHTSELAPRLEALGFAEVNETTDKFIGPIANCYTDFLEHRGLLDTYRGHIRERSYQGDNEDGQNATKSVPMWDSTPMPIPLDAYIDVWHGVEAAAWIERYSRPEPFFLFVGFPGPHDPWDAPSEAVDRYRGVEMSMPRSTKRPVLEGTGRYRALLESFLWVSDSATMTPDAIAGMRRSYAADISLIDEGVGAILGALERREMLENTWVIYTSDHGEMAGSHSMMSKCVLYDPAVRVPLIIRPAGGADARTIESTAEHLDVPATIRDIAGAAELPEGEGRSLLGLLTGRDEHHRSHAVSENWGFAAFVTDRHKLVVDEDALMPCQLFDRLDDPEEDRNLLADPSSKSVVEELMEGIARPFFRTAPARPHPSLFTP